MTGEGNRFDENTLKEILLTRENHVILCCPILFIPAAVLENIQAQFTCLQYMVNLHFAVSVQVHSKAF